MSGKSEFYRIFFSILVLVVTVIITRNLIFSLICMNVVALLIILCLDASVAAGRVKICIVRDYRRVFVLFKQKKKQTKKSVSASCYKHIFK